MTQTTMALILAAVLNVSGVATGTGFYNDALVVEFGSDIGFSLGGLIFNGGPQRPEDLAHEYGHVLQFRRAGVIYPFIALASGLLYLSEPDNYYDRWPESWADELGAVHR